MDECTFCTEDGDAGECAECGWGVCSDHADEMLDCESEGCEGRFCSTPCHDGHSCACTE